MEKNNEPAFNVDCISTSGVFKSWFSLIIIVQFFIGGLVLILVNLWFWNQLYSILTGTPFYSSEPTLDLMWWLLLPPNIYGNIFLFWMTILITSAGFYKILNRLHPPQEGVFERGSKDWKYMNRRFWTTYFPIWLARALPLPWADIIVYRLFGIRIGRNVVLYEGYVDPEFIEIGDHTMTSLNILIFSHLIYHDKVIIKKVKIGKNCILGPQTLVSPGSVMHDGSILGANSYTWVNQELKSDLIHVGTPVRMTFPIQSLEESQQKAERIKKEKGGN
jgi:acetyltransferase-like isoleucine patch superfamily enzyme